MNSKFLVLTLGLMMSAMSQADFLPEDIHIHGYLTQDFFIHLIIMSMDTVMMGLVRGVQKLV